jgi:hypothetical protein
MLKGGVKVACSAAENVNLAFYQNAVPIIRELAVENATGRDVSEIEVHLSSEPPFVAPGVWRQGASTLGVRRQGRVPRLPPDRAISSRRSRRAIWHRRDGGRVGGNLGRVPENARKTSGAAVSGVLARLGRPAAARPADGR